MAEGASALLGVVVVWPAGKVSSFSVFGNSCCFQVGWIYAGSVLTDCVIDFISIGYLAYE
jgi:hypothetical protein